MGALKQEHHPGPARLPQAQNVHQITRIPYPRNHFCLRRFRGRIGPETVGPSQPLGLTTLTVRAECNQPKNSRYTRHASMIEIKRNSDDIIEIRFGGEQLDSNDDGWSLPKALIGDIAVNELPEGERFEVCESIQEGVIMLDSIPISFQRKGDNRLRVEFNDSGTRKYWDGNVGFKAYMEAKRTIIEERTAEVKDVLLENYDDDGAWIHLTYSAEVEAEKLATAVQTAEQIVAEVEGAAEMRLGVELWAPSKAESEKEFTLGTVLPILRKLGFHNVRYNHGRREFGRDVLFARLTEFQDVEFWGAQVKLGDVSGGVDAGINELLGQIDDGFKMPFYDLYTKQQQRIAKLAIIISGKFTENAIEKICEKIESHAVKNNIVFVDGEKLATLAELFRGKI